MATKIETTVCDHQIQIDRSGVGRAWKNIDANDIPNDVRLAIECEILDGKVDACSDYVGSNGLHYRW